MSTWVQNHLFFITLAVGCYMLVTGAWRLFKHFRRKRAERKESDGRS